MTENERFILCNKTTDSNVWDTLEKQCYGWEYVVSLLNKFYDENKQLKSKNRGLQSELQIFKEDVTHSNLQINKLADENEQLKKELKKYTDAFDCSQCRFQNYDWFDDGDEFEVCEKGNNEAQMENHSCSEWEEI